MSVIATTLGVLLDKNLTLWKSLIPISNTSASVDSGISKIVCSKPISLLVSCVLDYLRSARQDSHVVFVVFPNSCTPTTRGNFSASFRHFGASGSSTQMARHHLRCCLVCPTTQLSRGLSGLLNIAMSASVSWSGHEKVIVWTPSSCTAPLIHLLKSMCWLRINRFIYGTSATLNIIFTLISRDDRYKGFNANEWVLRLNLYRKCPLLPKVDDTKLWSLLFIMINTYWLLLLAITNVLLLTVNGTECCYSIFNEFFAETPSGISGFEVLWCYTYFSL